MQQFVGTSLKTRLYLLVLVAFIPVAVLIFYIAEEQKAVETREILQQTMALAQSAADEENQQLESTRNLLVAVTDAFLMAADQPQKLSDLLAGLLKQSKGYADFGLVDPGGRLIAGAGVDRTSRDYSTHTWFATCLQSGDLAMGPYRGEHIAGQPVLYIALPALDNRRQIKAVAFAALNLDRMNRVVFKELAELPKNSRLTLLDEGGGMLRYDVDDGQWSVPQNFNPQLDSRIFAAPSGTLSAIDEQGVNRIYAFASLASTFRNSRVGVVLEIPRALALAGSKRIFTRNVALLVVSALMAVLSIWWAGDVFILRRGQAMVRVSRQLAKGDLQARIGKIGVRDELSHLAGVFDEMAASLQLRIEREQQALVSLEQSREQLRKLAAYEQEVREQERIRIAREIHDQFGQSLTILKMDLSWLNKQLADRMPGAEQKMAAMAEVINTALKNLHQVTAELRPVILDDFGLAAAIEWQIEEFSSRSGIHCHMEKTGFEPDLPKEQATALFRIFQETLTNIMRHAQADEVQVRLEEHNGELVLQVRDNGRGITEAEINDPKSFGLLGMRERLHVWNGQITFEGQPGLGTCVCARLSLSAKGEPQ
jgi:signal transduction histidine kinase